MDHPILFTDLCVFPQKRFFQHRRRNVDFSLIVSLYVGFFCPSFPICASSQKVG